MDASLPTPPSDDPPQSAAAPDDSPQATRAASPTEVPDGLPEYEPLTPELLEDEAIRGDFMLRWVVVGLALLFGIGEVTDATPLVHVRSGNWLASHGFWPPATDPLSISAADRRWINLSWLLDLFAAGVHAVGGGVLLSLVTGLIIALTLAIVVHACRPGIRTWWGSVCTAMVLLAAYPAFEFTPNMVTLLGVAVVMMLLVRSENTGRTAWLWALPLTMGIWCQCDPRAWIGVAILLAYAVGAACTRTALERQDGAPIPLRSLLGPVGISLGLLLVHPFFGEPLIAAWRQYAVEYPAYRQAYPRPVVLDVVWYPLWSTEVWSYWNHRLMAATGLAVAALVTMLLNRQRVSLGHGLIFALVNALAVVTTHEWPMASVVNAVLAAIHAQEWYKARFGQMYSVATLEVLFSRGGRAITLFGFVALAWLVMSGRLDGPTGRRTGVGYSRDLLVELDTYRALDNLTVDNRGFHSSLRQGDLLIAAGRLSFVDRRVGLFSGTGENDLLAVHDRTRQALKPAANPNAGREAQQLWTDTFQRFRLSHAVVRLVQSKDYDGVMIGLATRDWQLTHLLPTAGVMHWMGSSDPAVQKYAREHAFIVLNEAFRENSPVTETTVERPLIPTWSQQILSAPRRESTASTRMAGHYLYVARIAANAPWATRVGCYLMAIRAARTGIHEDPQQATPYILLGEAYSALAQLEQLSLDQRIVSWSMSPRYFAAAAALQQAVRLDPQRVQPYFLLFELYQQAGQVEPALAALEKVLTLTAALPDTSEDDVRARTSLEDRQVALESAVAQLKQATQKQLDESVDRLSVAIAAQRSGGVQTAVNVLQGDMIAIGRNPASRQFLTVWLAELGQGEALDESAAALESIGPRTALPRWEDAVCYASLTRGDYDAAIQLWQRSVVESDRQRTEALLSTAPLSLASPIWLGDLQYPLSHLAAAQQSLLRLPADASQSDVFRGLCEVERGRRDEATSAFRQALSRWPATPLRPLLRMYLLALTGDLIDEEPPEDWIPLPADVFAPESASAAAAQR